MSNLPNGISTPAGAVAGAWTEFTGAPGDSLRYLTWSQNGAVGIVVSVASVQYGDGSVSAPAIGLDGNLDEVSPVGARALALALLEAADVVDSLR